MAELTAVLDKQASTFHFTARTGSGATIQVDDPTSHADGTGHGASPMELLLAAVGGCSAIDVVSILEKGRHVVDDLRITVRGEKPEGLVPSLFRDIHIRYDIGGNVPVDRARRAIELSINTYCSVAHMLMPPAQIMWDFSIGGVVHEGGTAVPTTGASK